MAHKATTENNLQKKEVKVSASPLTQQTALAQQFFEIIGKSKLTESFLVDSLRPSTAGSVKAG